jgi:hypothetical protein
MKRMEIGSRCGQHVGAASVDLYIGVTQAGKVPGIRSDTKLCLVAITPRIILLKSGGKTSRIFTRRSESSRFTAALCPFPAALRNSRNDFDV